MHPPNECNAFAINKQVIRINQYRGAHAREADTILPGPARPAQPGATEARKGKCPRSRETYDISGRVVFKLWNAIGDSGAVHARSMRT